MNEVLKQVLHQQYISYECLPPSYLCISYFHAVHHKALILAANIVKSLASIQSMMKNQGKKAESAETRKHACMLETKTNIHHAIQ